MWSSGWDNGGDWGPEKQYFLFLFFQVWSSRWDNGGYRGPDDAKAVSYVCDAQVFGVPRPVCALPGGAGGKRDQGTKFSKARLWALLKRIFNMKYTRALTFENFGPRQNTFSLSKTLKCQYPSMITQ